MKHTPFQPQPRRNGPISRLCARKGMAARPKKSRHHARQRRRGREKEAANARIRTTGGPESTARRSHTRRPPQKKTAPHRHRPERIPHRRTIPGHHRTARTLKHTFWPVTGIRTIPFHASPHVQEIVRTSNLEISHYPSYGRFTVSTPSSASTTLSQEKQNPGNQSLPGFQAVISRFTLQRAEPCQP